MGWVFYKRAQYKGLERSAGGAVVPPDDAEALSSTHAYLQSVGPRKEGSAQHCSAAAGGRRAHWDTFPKGKEQQKGRPLLACLPGV